MIRLLFLLSLIEYSFAGAPIQFSETYEKNQGRDIARAKSVFAQCAENNDKFQFIFDCEFAEVSKCCSKINDMCKEIVKIQLNDTAKYTRKNCQQSFKMCKSQICITPLYEEVQNILINQKKEAAQLIDKAYHD